MDRAIAFANGAVEFPRGSWCVSCYAFSNQTHSGLTQSRWAQLCCCMPFVWDAILTDCKDRPTHRPTDRFETSIKCTRKIMNLCTKSRECACLQRFCDPVQPAHQLLQCVKFDWSMGDEKLNTAINYEIGLQVGSRICRSQLLGPRIITAAQWKRSDFL